MPISTDEKTTLKTRSIVFVILILGTVLLNVSFFRQLFTFSRSNEFSSHILLIPLVSAALIIYERKGIFSGVRFSIPGGLSIAVPGAALLLWLYFGSAGLSVADALSAKTLALVVLWIGAFLLLYGGNSFSKAVFPLLFLLMMVPIPQFLLEAVVSTLQKGSAEMTAILFKLTDTPHYRDDLTFVLPRISIEIARECSGIRSSLALLITSLLASHLMLRTVWRKFALVALAIPMAMFKNAIRIAALTLLSVHVDTRFLKNSDLHREGGILFYLLALLLMLPILVLLRRSERKVDKEGPTASCRHQVASKLT